MGNPACGSAIRDISWLGRNVRNVDAEILDACGTIIQILNRRTVKPILARYSNQKN